jgi:hypothetical protein
MEINNTIGIHDWHDVPINVEQKFRIRLHFDELLDDVRCHCW